MPALPRIVIIGGGFGGITAAKKLKRANAQVTVIDRTNHFIFQPLLYQVATAALAPSEITAPIRCSGTSRSELLRITRAALRGGFPNQGQVRNRRRRNGFFG